MFYGGYHPPIESGMARDTISKVWSRYDEVLASHKAILDVQPCLEKLSWGVLPPTGMPLFRGRVLPPIKSMAKIAPITFSYLSDVSFPFCSVACPQWFGRL